MKRPVNALRQLHSSFVAAEIAREFFPHADPATARVLVSVASLARKHEDKAAGAPLRNETRQKLARVVALATEFAELLAIEPLRSLNGENGFRAAARNALGREAETVTVDALRATAAGAEALLARIPAGQGAARMSDSFGNPRGRLICAVAAVLLIERFSGRRPGKTNPQAQALARRLWHLAGGSDSAAADAGDVDSLPAWERHIRAARAQGPDVSDAALVQARILVGHALKMLPTGDANTSEPLE